MFSGVMCRVAVGLVLIASLWATESFGQQYSPRGASGNGIRCNDPQCPIHGGLASDPCADGQCPPGTRGVNPSGQGWTNPAINWQTPPRQQARPQRQAAQGPLQRSVVQTICRIGGTTKRGTGTIIAVLKSTPRIAAVLTACHTLQAGGEISIRFDDTLYPAKIVDQDGTLDLALLTFLAPSKCCYMPLAEGDPRPGAMMTWEGFGSLGLFRQRGPVHGYEGSMIWVTGHVSDGVSGGPIFTGAGLVSVVTTGIMDSARSKVVMHVEGPALSWIKRFLRRGRYAWALEGLAEVKEQPTPKRLPLVPVKPAEDVPPPPVPEASPDCAELRILILQNGRDIANLRALLEKRSKRGEKGNTGERGLQGEQGLQGEKGEPGQNGQLGEPFVMDYDKLVDEVVKRMPPMRFQAKTVDGIPTGDIIEKRFGDILYMKSARPE